MATSLKILIVHINPDTVGGRRVAVQTNITDTFRDIFVKTNSLVSGNHSVESINSVKIYENSKHDGSEGIIVQQDMNVFSLTNEFSCRYVDYICTKVDVNHNEIVYNAFSVMMNSNKKYVLPNKPKAKGEKLTGPQTLLCDVIDFANELCSGWTADVLASGEKALKTLADALWYIDHAHTRFKENGCLIPEVFQKFKNYNKFSKYHHTEPKIKSEKISEICGDLTDATGMPSMSSERNKPLAMHIESLNAVLLRYNERLIKQRRKKHQDGDNSSDLQPDEEKSTETSCEFIQKVPGSKVEDRYVILDEYLSKMEQYEYVCLDDFTPLNRYKRREYIKTLKLSRSVNLYRVAYGGCVGTLSFIWVVSDNDSEERILKNSTIIKVLTEKLRKFSNRQMRRDFINKYFSFVKCPKSALRNMYFEISGYETSYESTDQRVIDERVAEKLLYSDDPKLLFDLRSTNGSDTVYDKFYAETAHYFDVQIMHVHERRKADELYMPLCISLEDLREQVKKRLPEDTPFPSTESFRLQFTPANQFSRTALKYSSKLNVKFRVQTRLARVYHQDAHYVAAYYKYMKEFMVTFSDNTVFVCLDDKAIVPVGEPGIPICTGVRGHNKVLTPADGAKLVGTDHDFHIGGIVPYVVLVSNIPESKDDSFFIIIKQLSLSLQVSYFLVEYRIVY